MGITVIGAGLAGCEAAWVISCFGLEVRLIEMKPLRYSPAHNSSGLAELVCSNSLRSADLTSAVGLLKEELRLLGSLIIKAADSTSVPAGRALAVDRDLFSRFITDSIESNNLITIERREVTSIPDASGGLVIISTGPLTSSGLAESISDLVGADSLSFYDAIAPIVAADSLDMSKLFKASRYEEGEGAYLNAPMDEELYNRFVREIVEAEKVNPHPFEDISHFEGCLPIEELARRGPQTLCFGPMKPVGLIDPKTGKRPYAVVQLRAENIEGSLHNLVGFQTKMTYAEQKRIFRMIPGLEEAEFQRLGSVHRNTYVDAPNVLDSYSRSIKSPHVFFAGQITGVEGYVESTASGHIVGLYAALLSRGVEPPAPPSNTSIGALIKHTRQKPVKKYEPMNVNFGMMDEVSIRSRKQKKEMRARIALESISEFKGQIEQLRERL
ncbi:MAG: methylenetetrahydrofolate--tRNA-(uracil(54)-C(5))-methyltransferase (FADH(2)-oxidizing) TrmFO [Desulfomonilaceae bacterium]